MTNNTRLRMFDEQISRKPDLYPWTQEFIDSMWNGHWTPNEFTFKSDLHDFYTKLSETDRNMLVKALSAIGQIEIAVKTFWVKLGQNLPHPSLNDLGIVMGAIEVIHNKAYEKLLDVLDLTHVFEDNLKLEIIKNRVNYLRKYNHKYYSDSKKQYIYAITLFTLFVENVSLFSQFYIACWIAKERNAIKDVDNQISYTMKEETIHALAGMKIINTQRVEYPELFDEELENRIIQESLEAYKAESAIIDWMVGDFNEPGLNAKLLKEFIKNRINVSLNGIGYKNAFENIDMDLIKQTEWLEMKAIGNNMKDFFHGRPTEYSKGIKVKVEDLF